MATRKKAAPQAAEAAPPAEVVVTAVKGFDANWRCRGFQFEVGQTYTHAGKVEACQAGFHACESPIDVFRYYEPAQSRFALVEMSGELSRHADDSKIAAARITIEAELTIHEIVTRTIAWITAQCEPAKASSATGDSSASSATGDRSASSATGYSSASSATGDRSASSATGIAAVALNTGRDGKSRASECGAIVICNHDDKGNLRHIFSSKVGENGIKPDVFYTLGDDGVPVEAAQ